MPDRIPAVADVMEAIIRRMGGAEGLANEFYTVYMAAGTGQATKTRMMDNLFRMMAALEPKEQFEAMTEEELTKTIKSLFPDGKTGTKP